MYYQPELFIVPIHGKPGLLHNKSKPNYSEHKKFSGFSSHILAITVVDRNRQQIEPDVVAHIYNPRASDDQ